MTIFVTCPVCEHHVAARIPKSGDGTAARPYWHKRYAFHDWKHRGETPCEGRFELVDDYRSTRTPVPETKT